MKKIFDLFFLLICVCSPLLITGCVDDDINTNYATADQLGENPEALVWAMPAKTVDLYSYSSSSKRHNDWGQGSLMHMRDVMGEDYVVTSSSYDRYNNWEENTYQGPDYYYAAIPWYTFYKQIQTSNNVISAIDANGATSYQLGFLATGYAYRAWAYLDAARMFE